MPESIQTTLTRYWFNVFPAYRGTGARVLYIADDWTEMRVQLRLNWRTKNYVGTIFGGSMYGAVDPIYMIMLIKALGPGYVVWDKEATIRFNKPGRSTLYANFKLEAADIQSIKEELTKAPKLARTYLVELVDKEGIVHAEVEKLLHIRRKE